MSNRDCRFPLTSPGPNEPHLFCGSPAVNGKPDCAAHCTLALPARSDHRSATTRQLSIAFGKSTAKGG
ncbi:GcrA family cell cycle regulator [Agrobacterium cavarae]|uniref:GcrA family cell cycle regulator n=1 Tax=Agrobacterium cavarae TaxID=2528239 RepID=UPI003A5211D2